MKALARSYLGWPNKDIVKLCRSCQPSKPWEHVHVDFAGSFQGTMLYTRNGQNIR